jgi:hypothetical protein
LSAFGGGAANQFIGIDRLNRVVAAGHALFLTTQSSISQTSNSFRVLRPIIPAASGDRNRQTGRLLFLGTVRRAVAWSDPSAALPHRHRSILPNAFTTSYGIGVQRELGKSIVVTADFYHRNMNDMLGIREANIAFQSRSNARQYLAPFTAGPIRTFGPWYEGTYDALVLSFTKRFSKRFNLAGSYTFADQTDNQLGVNALPTDNFIGIAPIVSSVEAGVLRTNANGGYTRANGRFVAAPDFRERSRCRQRTI